MRVRAAIWAGIVVASAAAAPTAVGRQFHITKGAYVAAPRFQVTYSGNGAWSTVYHSTPANPGASPDINDARDSSHQHWSLTFTGRLNARGVGTSELSGATGSARASGQIRHSHIDGIYAADNASVSCRVEARTPAHARLPAAIALAHLPGHRGLRLTAGDPVSHVLTLLPQQCPGQGDSLDGLADNYFGPGFSFAAGYGPARWFRSRPVLIPLHALQHAQRIAIALGPGHGAAPPAGCAVPYPSWQRCQTGGAWRGRLILRRIGLRAAPGRRGRPPGVQPTTTARRVMTRPPRRSVRT